MSFDRARILMSQREYQQALPLLKAALKDDPDNMEIRQMIAEAQERMMLQLQLDSKLSKAQNLAAAGDLAGARQAVDEVLKVDPGFLKAQVLMEQLAGVPEPASGPDPDSTMMMGAMPPLEPAGFDAAPEPLAPMDLSPAPLEAPPDATMMMSAMPDPAAPGGDLAPLESFGGGGGDDLQPLAPMGGPEPETGDAESTVFLGSGMADLEPAPGADDALPPLEPMSLDNDPADATMMIGESPLSAAGPAAPDLSHLSPEEAARVRSYLKDGQAAYDKGDFQAAVDIWTRVFILDENNTEAQRLIETAQERMADSGDDTDHRLAQAIAAYTGGELDKAESMFEDILIKNPGHAQAQEYLSQIETRKASMASRAPMAALPADVPPLEELEDMDLEVDGSRRNAPPPVAFPPPPPAAPPPIPQAVPGDAPAAMPGHQGWDEPPAAGPGHEPLAMKRQKKASGGGGKGLMVAAIGAFVVIAVFSVWFFVLRKPPEPPAPIKGPEIEMPGIEKPKPAPAPSPTPAPVAPAPQPVPAEAVGKTPAELVAMGNAAIQAHDYDKALLYMQEASKQDPLNTAVGEVIKQATQLKAERDDLVARIAAIRKSFLEGSQTSATNEAWQMYGILDDAPKQLLDRHGLTSQVVDVIHIGTYNRAVEYLRTRRPAEAARELDTIKPLGAWEQGDKLREFANRYVDSGPPGPDYLQAIQNIQPLNLP